MDALDGLLDGARARGAMFHQTMLEPPWSLYIAEEAPLTLLTMPRGDCWILPEGLPPVRLNTGDVAVVRGTVPYVVADDPSTPPQLVIHSGNRAKTIDGVDLTDELTMGVRTCGLDPHGSDVLLSAAYPVPYDVNERLLATLPTVLVVPDADARGPLMDLIVVEADRDDPGQQAVLDRLLDLALIATLRTWFARPEAEAPGWYLAQRDPMVGPALQLIHDQPARPWTVAALAGEVGLSRSVFAQRFTELVGESPMAYLTGWRLVKAADLLRETDATIESIARKVGYANAFALSVAFKRVRGVTPSQFRASAPREFVEAP
ncbi:AraC family transcriptional regulator [Phytoactinopolyspora limicola]|uniref:AraC family transcriptional regulator n=1 Tax=Phytoactinopolyspora limicola TaxID=2715536 RepID=UPI001409563F|nr:AraC family transcriptional regulator [Phytoactinopolyspora limicola]